MIKKAVLLTVIGYVAGCVIGLCFSLRSSSFSFADSLPQILLGGIPGAIAMGSAVIYDIEEWSLLRSTTTHFLLTMCAILLGCFVLDWFPPWSPPFWIMLAAELAAYILVWLIMYKIYQRKVRKLNELLRKNNPSQKS